MADNYSRCNRCGADVTAEANAAASCEQFSGFNPMSLQYAEAWSEGRLAGFLATYVCDACRAVEADRK